MLRTVVTGARGMLGSTLVPHLLAGGYEVITCSRADADVCADLTDMSLAARALDEAAPEVIVNLVGKTNVDECERDPQAAYLANTRVVENLAAWIAAHGNATHLIQISTDQNYDGPGPHSEDTVVISNTYGLSKYAGELAAATVPSTVLRTNFFGRSRSPSRASLSDWIVRSLSQGDEITVFEDLCFSPLTMTRLSEMVELAVQRRRTGVFNVGSTGAMTKADFAFAVAEVLDLPPGGMRRGTSATAVSSAVRPKDMSMNSARFESNFGVVLPTLRGEIESLANEYADAT